MKGHGFVYTVFSAQYSVTKPRYIQGNDVSLSPLGKLISIPRYSIDLINNGIIRIIIVNYDINLINDESIK
jgi:hypothetical protein